VLQVEPQIVANYVATGQVRLAFSHLVDHGEPSRLAHKTAECAGQQTPLAFWQMHELLYQRQGELWSATHETMMGLAAELGLDGTALRSCLDDAAIAEKITRMDQVRREQGLRTRPSFDLNGQIIQGAIPYPAFAQLFDEALNSQ
jgi:protein-disulfide isomerase